jgi:hypothetical protein
MNIYPATKFLYRGWIFIKAHLVIQQYGDSNKHGYNKGGGRIYYANQPTHRKHDEAQIDPQVH